MNVCNRPACQTTAGCAFRGPRGEYCWIAGDIPNPIRVHREGDCPYCQGTGKQMRYRVADAFGSGFEVVKSETSTPK